MSSHKQRQSIPVIVSAFDDGHHDGYADAVNGSPCDPSTRFQTWQRRRPVDDFADYERGYRASYDQVRAECAS